MALILCCPCLLFATVKYALCWERNGAGDKQCLTLWFFVWIAMVGQSPAGWAFINELSNKISCTFLGWLLFWEFLPDGIGNQLADGGNEMVCFYWNLPLYCLCSCEKEQEQKHNTHICHRHKANAQAQTCQKKLILGCIGIPSCII